ncbi:hypothetical protein B566_EDAN014111 [Ephemera danica]|nr:hypothetical protein B566_EDAN014111 [Ephemera danica]
MERENTFEQCYVLRAILPPNIPREALELNKIPVLQEHQQQQHQQQHPQQHPQQHQLQHQLQHQPQQQQQQQDDVNTESNVILDNRILKITQTGSAIQIETKGPVKITFREKVGRRRGHSGESGDDDDSPPPLQDQDETSADNATTNVPGNRTRHADKPKSNQGCRSGGRTSTRQQTTNNSDSGEATTLKPCSVVLERVLECELCSFVTVHNKELAAHRAEHHKASEGAGLSRAKAKSRGTTHTVGGWQRVAASTRILVLDEPLSPVKDNTC